jgi:hypothetical protein
MSYWRSGLQLLKIANTSQSVIARVWDPMMLHWYKNDDWDVWLRDE